MILVGLEQLLDNGKSKFRPFVIQEAKILLDYRFHKGKYNVELEYAIFPQ